MQGFLLSIRVVTPILLMLCVGMLVRRLGWERAVDRLVRREAATVFRKQQVIASMIDSIQKVLRMDEVEHGAGDDRDP